MALIYGVLLACLIHTSVAQDVDYEYIGFGVGHRTVSSGENVFIGYPGWSVSEGLGRSWVNRLVEKSDLVSQHRVGHAYAVKGPDDVFYEDQEIENSALIRHLLTYAENVDTIIVAAHSSGAFVANELFYQLYDLGADENEVTRNKIVYFDLDGDGGFSSLAQANIKSMFFVYAKAGDMLSMNGELMMELGNQDQTIPIDASDSGCNNKYCLHDVMINRSPWDKDYFDLESDYSLFDDTHEVQSNYLSFSNPK